MRTVLVVDDSALVRKVLRDFFEQAGFAVLTAKSGRDALYQLETVCPDVVTLDIQMPDLDGLSVLNEIMTTRAVPVVMVSVLTGEGSRATVEALTLGAVDFVAKPDASISLRMDEVRDQLVEKVRAASRAQVHTRSASTPTVFRPPPAADTLLDYDPRPCDVVLIGSSTGGPGGLTAVISELPADFPPVVIAQHLPATFTPHLSTRLDRAGQMACQEVGSAVALRPGNVYVGRGGADVVVTRRGTDLVVKNLPVRAADRWHPSVDRLTRSAMEATAPRDIVGVLLSGMGDDGAEAMTDLADAGGRTVAESAASAVVWGMPGALVARGGATSVLDAERVADQLCAWLPRTTSCRVTGPAHAPSSKEH